MMTCSYPIIKVQKVIYHCMLCNHPSSEVSFTFCWVYYKAVLFSLINISSSYQRTAQSIITQVISMFQIGCKYSKMRFFSSVMLLSNICYFANEDNSLFQLSSMTNQPGINTIIRVDMGYSCCVIFRSLQLQLMSAVYTSQMLLSNLMFMSCLQNILYRVHSNSKYLKAKEFKTICGFIHYKQHDKDRKTLVLIFITMTT